jgi:ribosome-binding factor A
MSSSIRQQKVNSLLQKELAIIFQKESRNLFRGALITVTIIRISPDLGFAKVYLSFFMTKDKEELLKNIRSHATKIRYELGQIVGKQLRVVPGLQFYHDDSLDYAQNIDDLLKN